jgi:hypothetical protein
MLFEKVYLSSNKIGRLHTYSWNITQTDKKKVVQALFCCMASIWLQ